MKIFQKNIQKFQLFFGKSVEQLLFRAEKFDFFVEILKIWKFENLNFFLKIFKKTYSQIQKKQHFFFEILKIYFENFQKKFKILSNIFLQAL